VLSLVRRVSGMAKNSRVKAAAGCRFQVVFGKHLAQFGQHCGIGQMKQKCGEQKIEKHVVFAKSGKSLDLNLVIVNSAAGLGIVNLAAINCKNAQQGGNGHENGDKKNGAVTKLVTGLGDQNSGTDVA
jgi:hypothetical protein